MFNHFSDDFLPKPCCSRLVTALAAFRHFHNNIALLGRETWKPILDAIQRD
jgi:hypothetical protein